MRSVALHYDPAHCRHDVGAHPEHPGRVEAIARHLDATGTLRSLSLLEPRAATDDELQLVHPPRHVDRVRRLDETGGGSIDPDTSVVPGSFLAATHAAGGLLAGVDTVLAGSADAAFCLARPPGHHATASQAMGFCLFNNVAVAAEYARRNHGVERVAIIDFDVHHGNGTQEIFWDNANVLYLSLHQYPFYPGSGHWREIGGPNAAGRTVNLPLEGGSGDREYLRCFDRIFTPLIERFEPELLMISAGYDAHDADPLAGMAVSTEGYRAIMRRLRMSAEEVCGGRLVAALEGGYDLADLSASVRVSLEALLEERPAFEPAAPASTPFERYLDRLRELHTLN